MVKGFERSFEIEIHSSEANKDKGFSVLRDSKSGVVCLENEKYIIPKSAIDLLKKSDILYKVLKVNGVEHVQESSD